MRTNLGAWARRIGLGLVAGGSVAALLALTGAPQAAPQLEWTHSGTSVTHFECFVDGAYAGNLGKPEPVGNAYSANLSLCGQITAGQHTLSVKACNYTNCTDASSGLTVVALSNVGSGTQTCVGPAQTAVQDAVNAADYGDTVEVCGGSATWTATTQGCTANSMLCMKKGITLRGGVGGTTTITLSGSAPYGAICYEPDATSRLNDTPFSFSGFTVDGGGNIDDSEGMVDVRSYGTTPITKVTIHHNTFQNCGHPIVINGLVYGVAYDNTLIETWGSIKSEMGGWTTWDIDHRVYGTANSFFFEDNAISCTTAPSCGVFTAGQGGGIVFRYNSTDLGQVLLDGNQLYDLHGLQSMTDSDGGVQCGEYPYNVPNGCLPNVKSCGQFSHLKSEYYGNKITNFRNIYDDAQEWIRDRGSWLLMFDNDIKGTGWMPLPNVYQYSCDSCATQGSYDQHVNNTYVWSNIGQGYGNRPMWVKADYCGSYAVGTPYTITENRDYYNLNASFDGTTGVGCGPLASRPATCTTGVAYWATTQSCSDLTGIGGKDATTPVSGTLYKCTATNTWTAYYTPYTYPHPKAATPAAAASLRVK